MVKWDLKKWGSSILPQNLRFFWGWGLGFQKFWGFLRLRAVQKFRGFWWSNLKNPQKLRWGWGQDFWGFLRNPQKSRKINKKDWKILLTCLKIWGLFEDPRKFSFEVNPQKPSRTEVRMRAAFLRLRVKVLRFLKQKGLRFFKDKTSKTLNFRGEDKASIFKEFYHTSDWNWSRNAPVFFILKNLNKYGR